MGILFSVHNPLGELMTNETYGPNTSAWKKLEEKAELLSSTNITSLFLEDLDRGRGFSREAQGFYLDFSRQHLDSDSLTELFSLAEQTKVTTGINNMFSGKPVNNTEARPAMHVALRRPIDAKLLVDKENIMSSIKIEREKMRSMVDQLHAGQLKGHTGEKITDVVNIGIGGSHIGPLMTTKALTEYQTSDLNIHFISGADGLELSNVLDCIEADKTLFIICSKSFETLETLMNARFAREWLHSLGGDSAIEAQFIGVSSNEAAMG